MPIFMTLIGQGAYNEKGIWLSTLWSNSLELRTLNSYVIHIDKTMRELEQHGLTIIGETIYAIVVDDVQEYAERRIRRKLTEDELYSVKKGICSGLSCDINVVYEAAIDEAVREENE